MEQNELLALTTNQEVIEHEEMYYNQEWADTPIWIRGKPGQYYSTLGDYAITEPTTTIEEQEEKLKQCNGTLLTVIATIVEQILKLKESEK